MSFLRPRKPTTPTISDLEDRIFKLHDRQLLARDEIKDTLDQIGEYQKSTIGPCTALWSAIKGGYAMNEKHKKQVREMLVKMKRSREGIVEAGRVLGCLLDWEREAERKIEELDPLRGGTRAGAHETGDGDGEE